MCYTLPKIWVGRIQKYWEKIMPENFPKTDSVFSLTFEAEDKAAVEDFEENLYSEDSVVLNLIPEGSYVKEYIGTYDVTYDGEVPEEGVRTLLSPEKIVTNETLTALHYENGEWVVIEDAELVDGYMYGTLKSFSPVAIISSRKEIHLETSVPGISVKVSSYVVCEGNPVLVTLDKEGKTVVINTSTNKTIELTSRSVIIGGSIDGSKIDKTSVTLKGLKTNAIVYKVIGGSVYMGEGFAEVGEVNVTVDGGVGSGVTGSYGAIHTDVVNMNLSNAIFAWVGAGEGYAGVNTPPVSLASRAWLKKANWKIVNCNIPLLYFSQNCEYYYVESNEATVIGGNYDYMISGGSNHATGSSVVTVEDAKIGIYQSTNRGVVDSADIKFTNCEVENLFVGGDPTDSTVTGTTNNIKIDICKGGKYNIGIGTEAGQKLTAEDIDRIVNSIKVTRNADITIDPELVTMLGSKYIVK